MCGIAGIWNRDGREVGLETLHLMSSAQAHRGPDGEVNKSLGEIGFSFRRLAILDLSEQGSQPVVSSNGRWWLLFNGEIHNYLELREELESRGQIFRSVGDAEVVLSAYLEWGTECFSKFNGMWGLAIWDNSEKVLLLSRDRLGIKPLYYSVRGSRIAFSSEPKAITAVFPEERVTNEIELGAFLMGASPDRGGTQTFFRNIQSLEPATYRFFTMSNTRTATKYWRLQSEETTLDNPEERFRELLFDSVRLRMRSDAPIGVCLSGGLDSSSVTRFAVSMLDRPIHCFSLRYPNHPSHDESLFSKAVADDPDKYLIHWVEPKRDDLIEVMSKVAWHHDSPTPIRGRLAAWALFREARKHVAVNLVGEGGDELLAGYGRFVLPYLLDRIKFERLAKIIKPKEVKDWIQLVIGTSSGLKSGFYALLLPVLKLRSPGGGIPTHFISPELLANQDQFRTVNFSNTWLRRDVDLPFSSHLNNALWLDLTYSGLPEILQMEDTLGMAFSLENRPPFLDHRLVEFCFSLNYSEKVKDGRTKDLLRKAMVSHLPEQVIERKDKKGMPTPYNEFFLAPENLQRIRSLLVDGELQTAGFVTRRGLIRLLGRLESTLIPRTTGLLSAIWRCTSADLWIRQSIQDRFDFN